MSAKPLAAEQITEILRRAQGTAFSASANLLADEILRLRDELVDALDEMRGLREHVAQLDATPTTEAAIAQLREWVPDYEVGATHVAMTVPMARKLMEALDESRRELDQTRTVLPAEFFDALMAEGEPHPAPELVWPFQRRRQLAAADELTRMDEELAAIDRDAS